MSGLLHRGGGDSATNGGVLVIPMRWNLFLNRQITRVFVHEAIVIVKLQVVMRAETQVR